MRIKQTKLVPRLPVRKMLEAPTVQPCGPGKEMIRGTAANQILRCACNVGFVALR